MTAEGGLLPCQGCGGPKSSGYGRHFCQGCWEKRARAWQDHKRETILDRAYLAEEMSKR